MSELKAYIAPTADGTGLAEYYLKSEADKVIANRDYEIAELKKSIGKLLKSKTEQIMDEVKRKTLIYGEGFVPVEHAMKLVAEIRHSNYKRCLAMAKWCWAVKELNRYGDQDYMDFAEKWHKRWLELAEVYRDRR